MIRLSILLILFSLLASDLFAQEGAWENSTAINYSIGTWRLNTSISHRTIKEKRDELSTLNLAFIEVNQFVTKKINPSFNISIGYKYRDLSNEDIEQRLTEQMAYIHLRKRIRLVSRMRLEQRFRSQFAHRYRYRFSADMPLSGLKLDKKEFYLVASNEILLEIINSSSILDNRLSLGTGYVISKAVRIQADATIRMENLNHTVDYIPFITTSLIFSSN